MVEGGRRTRMARGTEVLEERRRDLMNSRTAHEDDAGDSLSGPVVTNVYDGDSQGGVTSYVL